ncbi:calcium/calmodulin-dependent protein kinase kinase 2-like isoform X1 [Anopheles albimanus]|uniref:calcium/calmodulin-dependent protein kinase kinase 2-like isoform X1 n=2 Tax=Anopheles albimanus TaxID=7167 RepID=UPI0016419EDA|nr:calcium/calmodulin-dependent protein kinase kinase 2-like isoform X1 [Anopheles albimanus]XP_035783001.1 calcium/calmodulin-dependent protein kinase kinase 2-like isoform X1 [Anopheles albimanus]XP_035783002.1 calcium/calmodulin-dependent protein kinase kinase 2-like isoform X1 [Anopheles albimanus]XP_035783003.1 calcium/calmodulin-dependent protein kinase kinase 2-like isoform X1 [Anopheles albimanus]XP_035783004.1 calcium/calmodulin-dependent protein kinase kinase 2-like isoform X1 [Anophe
MPPSMATIDSETIRSRHWNDQTSSHCHCTSPDATVSTFGQEPTAMASYSAQLPHEMSPTVQSEVSIEPTATIPGLSTSSPDTIDIVTDRTTLGDGDRLLGSCDAATNDGLKDVPEEITAVPIVITAEDGHATNDSNSRDDTTTTTSSSSSNISNNNSTSMKCLNNITRSSSSARKSQTTPPHATSGYHAPVAATTSSSSTHRTDNTRRRQTPSTSPTQSCHSSQFVNHSPSCRDTVMGTSGSLVAGDGETAHEPVTSMARGLADVVRVSTSVPQPVIVRTEPGGGGTLGHGQDNDDMLEASNRSESQLEISAAGSGGGAPGLRGCVLPKLQTLDQTTRPIYPNVPYSPYNSPYGSPRSGRRRTPLRESRRVSIEQSGSFLQLNQYKLLDQIGQGSYGLVKLAYSEEDSTHYAMKILSKRKLLRKAGLMRRGPKRGTSPLDRVYREIAVLKKLDHPNVVKLVEVLDDPLEDSLYLVFELVQQGEVLSIPTDTPLSEERAWNVFRDVLLGVEYLHYQRIIHGDLKPANLLLSDVGSVKVADLGVCNEFLGEDAAMNNGSTAGTPAFRAPETLLPGQHFYNGKAADIWALGATLYSLVHGNVPFIATSVPGVYEKIKSDPLEYPPTSTISDELRDLIGRMLDKDPQQRITLPQIKEHPWLTKNGAVRLPTEEENCRLVQISDEDMNSVVKSIPKLDTLILIKTMLKKHSFQNPFTKGISGRAPQAGGSRLERFCRSGRSNSAPGDYHTSERQSSNESLLPSVTEGVTSPLGSPDPSSSLTSAIDSLTLISDTSIASSSTDNDTTTLISDPVEQRPSAPSSTA